MKETQTNITDFKTKGFVTLPYPPVLREAVKEVAVLWQKFPEINFPLGLA